MAFSGVFVVFFSPASIAIKDDCEVFECGLRHVAKNDKAFINIVSFYLYEARGPLYD